MLNGNVSLGHETPDHCNTAESSSPGTATFVALFVKPLFKKHLTVSELVASGAKQFSQGIANRGQYVVIASALGDAVVQSGEVVDNPRDA
jgi:hypothetical protein